MKRILITGAGGTPALNFIRSLRLSNEPFYLIGVDSNQYYLARAETDERHLVPRADEPDYIEVLQQIVRETGSQLVFAQPDVEIAVLSEHRSELGAMTFWPRHETILICQDKYAAYRVWRAAGLPVPETRLLKSPDDLDLFFEEFDEAWVRAKRGAAGRGAFYARSVQQAKMWIDLNDGWGSFTAAQYLSPTSVTWQSIWNRGELIVAQGRQRLYWEFADRSPSGVTGITGGGVTTSDEELDDISRRAILAIDPEPHGVFSVDLTYDAGETPNLTEINIGRFFTTHLFFTAAGLNMPHILVRLAFDEPLPSLAGKLNPLPSGQVWIRGMDMEPVLTDESAIKSMSEALHARRANLKSLRTTGN